MLSPKLIPTPLVRPQSRPPLPLDGRPPRAHFRVLHISLHALGLLARILWFWLLGRLTEDRLGDMLRRFCQRLGVLWIKVGQLVSMRPDLVPPGVRAQLSRLWDRVPGFPGDVAVACIEAELGAPLDRLFSDFDPTPVAAASIAQVHKARLREEGVWVAVKVRRPEAVRVSHRDLALIRFLVRCLEWVRFRPEGRWRDMFWEVREAMLEELDYRYEATNMRRLKKNLRWHGIYVPQVFGRYCTPAVLVMEFIHGVLMSDYLGVARADPQGLTAWREANHVKPATVARRFLHSLFRQTFEENLFHGDLHPGNIVLLRDSRIAFLDFGSLGSMERDLTRKVDQYLQALGTRQYAKMVDLFFLFAPSLPPINLAECKGDMIRRLLAWDLRTRVPDLPFHEKSFAAIQDELMMFAATYGVAPVWSFFRLTRAITTMDASLRELMPRANFHRLIQSYYRKRGVRLRSQPARILRASGVNLRDWFELQDRLLDDMNFRSMIVRRAAQVFEQTTSRIALFFARLFGRVATLFLAAAIILLLAALRQHAWPAAETPPLSGGWLGEGLDHLPRLDVQVWILILFGLLAIWRQFTALSKRFREQDPQGGEG
jgi:ubiquinone biosynthesis protein